MHSQPIHFQQNPSLLHDELRENLKKEVYLTRELLSNIHQEEISLMLHDQGSVNHILQQRSSLLERLASLRSCRLQTTHKIADLYQGSSDGLCIEITSLSGQLEALSQKIASQLSQNRRLSEHPDAYPQSRGPYGGLQRPKKKSTVITMQIKK